MKHFLNLIALGAVVAASSTLAFATPVTPGGTVVTASNDLTVTNDGIVGQVSGTLTARTFTGSYTEYVIKDGSNPYGIDDLTFLITVSNDAGSSNGIEHISDGDGNGAFAMFPSVNVGYGMGPGAMGTAAPVTVDETIYGTVEFNFTGADSLLPGTGTQYLIIQTPAMNFTLGNLGAIDSSTDTETGLVPSAVTPEPSSLFLLGTGLLGSASTLLKRRKAVSSL